jgi:hypothetical protein
MAICARRAILSPLSIADHSRVACGQMLNSSAEEGYRRLRRCPDRSFCRIETGLECELGQKPSQDEVAQNVRLRSERLGAASKLSAHDQARNPSEPCQDKTEQ